MSDKNKKDTKPGAWIKYTMILALLVLAPVTLINQIVMPVVS